MKPAEALAKRIIEGVEVGERMIYREDQSVRTQDSICTGQEGSLLRSK